ncbi:MAG TPA: hypothetical protein VNF24_06750 [Candidatus Acidoferrales bacterium]|nr:hypothetical protein [Candidatus Acidoferrales bacterium]
MLLEVPYERHCAFSKETGTYIRAEELGVRILVKSAGCSGRKRPPSLAESGHPGREVGVSGLELGGATTIHLLGNAPVAVENVLGEAYIVAGAGVMWTGRRAVQAQGSGA